jgi:hypothetical protein
MQSGKYSKKTFKMEFRKKPKTTSEVLEMTAVLGYEGLGGLPGIDPLGTARKLPVRKKKSDPYDSTVILLILLGLIPYNPIRTPTL